MVQRLQQEELDTSPGILRIPVELKVDPLRFYCVIDLNVAYGMHKLLSYLSSVSDRRAGERLFLPRGKGGGGTEVVLSGSNNDGRPDLDLITQIHTAYLDENRLFRLHPGFPCIDIEQQWGSSRLKS